MFEAMSAAFEIIFAPQGLLLLIIGSSIGIIFGALPGLGTISAAALLIPLTYDMSLAHSMILLVSTLGAATFGGSISAILLNTPGMPVNAATCFDGYPLTCQGKAGMALGASATASAGGALFSVFWLVLLVPVMFNVAVHLGPPEVFAISLIGLFMVGIVTARDVVWKGIVSSSFGLVISFIGWNSITGNLRYTVGIKYLWDGIPLIPAIIGMFAISAALGLLAKGERGKIVEQSKLEKGGVWKGIKSVFEHKWTFLRGATIGTIIGIIPGVGGTVANFLAYVQEVEVSKNPENFGKGDIRGVIAPEAANNAKDGGAMIPTLALGVPGSPFCAVFLGAFVVHGVWPGLQLFSEHLEVIWIIIFALICSNILSSTIGIILTPLLIKVIVLPTILIAPVVLILSVVGVYASRQMSGDLIMAGLFAVFAYFLQRYKFPVAALIVGFVLGPIVENTFYQTIQIGRGSYSAFYTRPITISVLVIGFLIILRLIIPKKGGKKIS